MSERGWLLHHWLRLQLPDEPTVQVSAPTLSVDATSACSPNNFSSVHPRVVNLVLSLTFQSMPQEGHRSTSQARRRDLIHLTVPEHSRLPPHHDGASRLAAHDSDML